MTTQQNLSRPSPLARGAIALAVLFCAAGAGAAGDVLGQVSSVSGQATAQRPGEEPRALACGDDVYADDTLRTGASSRLGVMLDDVAAHLAPDTRVTLGRTAQAMPAARLEAGQIRMLDPRDSGAPAQLAALDASAEVLGNDAEGYIFTEKVGPYAMLCEWDAPLAVSRTPGEKLAADPGECVISKPKEPLYTAKAHEERQPMDVAEVCDLGPELAQLSSPLHHLSPRDVASPPPPAGDAVGDSSAIVAAVSPVGHDSCDLAAGACFLGLPLDVPAGEDPVGGGDPFPAP